MHQPQDEIDQGAIFRKNRFATFALKMQVPHNSGPLKQSNKSHKTGGHRSKGAVDRANKGRVGIKAQPGRKNKAHLSRRDRKHQMAQVRSKKKAEVLLKKRALGAADAAPILVALVDLQRQTADAAGELLRTVKTCAEDVVASSSPRGATHVAFPRFRQRFAFVRPDPDSPLQILDATKVADAAIFLVSANEDIERDAEETMALILSQGLPSEPVFLLTDLDSVAGKKQGDVKKSLLKALNRRFPVEKLHTCRNQQDGVLLLRHLGNLKRRLNNLRDKRGHMIAESAEMEGGGESEDASHGTLRVTGYVRSQTMSADRLVHLPGVGCFALDRIETAPDAHPLEKSRGRDAVMADAEAKVLARRDPDRAEPLRSENEPDMFDGEQYLSPEDEEMADAVPGANGSGESKTRKKVFKVPKGTSEYQAAWIIDMEEEDDEDGESSEEDEDMEDPAEEEVSDEEDDDDADEYETMTVTSEANMDDNYDEKHVNWAEELETVKKMQTARTDEMFPDEVDTPMDQQARIRFQKYRGLKSFRTSPWDPKENLPSDYARIFQFKNFNRTKKAILARDDVLEGAEAGQHVTLFIRDVPVHLIRPYLEESGRPLVVYGMLPHENKMSVLNFVVKRHSLGHQNPIASKERLIFHCGYRRFAACPIFSQHTNGGKHKYERFWRADSTVVMTIFAPIFFPPCSIVACQVSATISEVTEVM